jgi:hypothetical protein
MAMNHVEEFLARLGILRIVEQRLGIAFDRREGRAQLVRHVRHEVATHLVGPAQLGDVVHHQHRAAPGGHHWRHVGDQRARAVPYDGQLQAFGFFAGERATDVLDDARVSNGFDVRAIE